MCNREKDLKEWQDIENLFVSILKQKNQWCSIEQPEWYFKDYDLKLTKANWDVFTFEIKYDRMCTSTGNVAIEVSYNSKPSGVIRSISDYIVYYIDGNFRCIKTEELRNKIKDLKTIRWWDNSLSELVLVKKDIFTSRCIKYDGNNRN